jgi:hypothetical protein
MGKVVWHYPDVAQTMWAIERVLRKALPDLAGLQLSGDKDSPVLTEHTEHALGGDVELARRIALVQRIVQQGPQEPEEPPTSGQGLVLTNASNGAQRTLEPPGESPDEFEVGLVLNLPEKATATLVATDRAGIGDWKVMKADGKKAAARSLVAVISATKKAPTEAGAESF